MSPRSFSFNSASRRVSGFESLACRRMSRCWFLAALVASVAAAARLAPDAVFVLNLQAPPPHDDILAVQVCCGLFNRAPSNVSCYTVSSASDLHWLSIVAPLLPSPPPFTPITAFMRVCFASVASNATIEYDYKQQQELVPNILTVAAALAAVPLAPSSPFMPASPRPLFNATSQWPPGTTPLQATRYVYHRWANVTRTIAMMNPGYDVHGHPLSPRPPLTQQPDLALADYIVKDSLFNFFLVDACVPGTEEHAFMQMVATSSLWEQPIAVWGYDDTFPVAGDLFEAETNCVPAHTMGQVATSGATNLAFFSKISPPITAPLLQPPPLPFSYNSSKTYLSIIIGDGDNIAMAKTDRFEWMKQRVERCGYPAAPCAPLLWTLSPHLARAAPDIMRWFFAAAAASQRDFFVLPPSGHLYAYPGHMSPPAQDAFVAATEHDAYIMNSSGTCEWEFFNTWAAALDVYLPKYSHNAIIKAAFATNVPYMFPVPEFGGQHFKILNGSVVVFAPNEWRGTSGQDEPWLHPQLLSAEQQADKIAAYGAGAAVALYVTSDGGASLQDVDRLVVLLPEHVQVVDADGLIAAALASAGKRS